MGRLVLVLGGQRSGKSSYAAQRAGASGREVTVLAPAEATDPEMAQRIARHRAERPRAWRTIEGFDLVKGLEVAGADDAVVLDQLDTWLAHEMHHAGLFVDGDTAPSDASAERAVESLLERVDHLVAAARARAGPLFVIAGLPGLGLHAMGAGTRRYVDVHGLALQRLGAAADEVVELVAGRPRSVDDRPAAAPAYLREHGDRQVPPGAVDLAVNVHDEPPPWLVDRLRAEVGRIAPYPDDGPARAAAAARHGRPPGEALVLNGAAEGFWLLAGVLRPRLAACLHPSFTEPEAALRAAGVPVVRVHRDPERSWRLDPATVPEAADLVVIGRPDNPTGVLDDIEGVRSLARDGRTLVVDEAFAEFLPDAAGLAGDRATPGLICVRSLTKLWGLAGLRVGYLTGPADLIAALDAARQPWSVNQLALVALEAVLARDDVRRQRADDVAAARDHLVDRLAGVAGVTVWDGAANFVLLCTPGRDLAERLLHDHGLAVRRCASFPGLDERYLRVAVRDAPTSERLAAAIASHLGDTARDR